jgi:hypothetical protein
MAVSFKDIIVTENEIMSLEHQTSWDKVVAQISKDLLWGEIPFVWKSSVELAYKEMYELLNGWVIHFMEKDPEVLAQGLYRVDVPEIAIAKAEMVYPEMMPSEIMAHGILRRCIQKIFLRQRYSQK